MQGALDIQTAEPEKEFGEGLGKPRIGRKR